MMENLKLETQISLPQLYELLAQLPTQAKIALANHLRAEASAEQFKKLSDQLPDVEINSESLIEELKIIRRQRYEDKKAL